MKKTQAPDYAVTPDAVYGCQYGTCSENVTYPPHMLFWLPDMKMWVCENCFSCMDDNPAYNEDQELGESLRDFLDRRAMAREVEEKCGPQVRLIKWICSCGHGRIWPGQCPTCGDSCN